MLYDVICGRKVPLIYKEIFNRTAIRSIILYVIERQKVNKKVSSVLLTVIEHRGIEN